jgi:hypothetical protein
MSAAPFAERRQLTLKDIYDEKFYKDVYIGTVSISIKDILHRNLNATETSLFQYDFYVKITWHPLPEP